MKSMKTNALKMRSILAIPAIMLVLGMAVIGCKMEDENSLSGTTWTRTVNSNTGTMKIYYLFELTFTDANNAKIHQTGYTQQTGKPQSNIDNTSEYTYNYDTKANADGWQGALTPKSSSNLGYVFKISGKTLTTWTASGSVDWTKK